MTMRPRAKAEDGRRRRAPYPWIIEGDIKGCFDNIDHHKLMQRVRARIGDIKVTRLLGQFLKAGVLADGIVLPTSHGTPQGGVISPLLANIALGVIEERYERWTHHRRKIRAHRRCDPVTAAMGARMSDRKAGRPYSHRSGMPTTSSFSSQEPASKPRKKRRHSPRTCTRRWGWSYPSKRPTFPIRPRKIAFLGHRVRYKWHPRFGLMPRIEIPNDKRADIRYKVKQMTTRSTIGWSLSHLLQKLNPILRGWGNYFRFCTGASAIFASIDWYVGDRIWRWLMKKHGSLSRKKTTIRRLPSRLRPTRRVWREGATEQFLLSSLVVERFQRGWMRAPAFAMVPGKPDA